MPVGFGIRDATKVRKVVVVSDAILICPNPCCAGRLISWWLMKQTLAAITATQGLPPI